MEADAAVALGVGRSFSSRNFASIPHVDGKNRGGSWGLAFGTYDSAGIWVLDEENGTVKRCIKKMLSTKAESSTKRGMLGQQRTTPALHNANHIVVTHQILPKCDLLRRD